MIALEGAYCPWIHCCDDKPRLRAWQIPQRRLAHWLAVTSLDGGERIVVDGTSYEVAEGETYLIQPGRLHDLGGATARGNTPVWVHFDLVYDQRRTIHPLAGPYESQLGRREPLLQPDSEAVFGVDLPVLVPPALTPVFREGVPNLVRCWKRQERLAVLQSHQLLGDLLLALVAHVAAASQREAPMLAEDRIARAEAVALNLLGSGFDLDDFAAAAGYSRSRFCAIYRRLRRQSPGVFLRHARMRQACALLERRDLGVRAVGELVGYPDPSVFGRVFRAQFGQTPGAWRLRRHGSGAA